MRETKRKQNKAKHPTQPVVKVDGVHRFKVNAIVRDLLDFASPRGMSLNEIAMHKYSAEDRRQFAQLIGYSVSGYGELSYVNDEAWAEAAKAERALLKKKGRR